MNRLVIVGNGFDLAHGLPTGYCDFIDWYWSKVVKESNDKFPIDYSTFHYKDELIKIQLQFNERYDDYQFQKIRQQFGVVKDFSELDQFIQMYTISDAEIEHLEFSPKAKVNNCRLTISNHFFKIINDRKNIQNWVDIENDYYKLLKDCLKNEDNKTVIKLNEEFEQIKKLLEKYLIENILAMNDFKKPNDNILEILKLFKIKPKYVLSEQGSAYLKEFPESDHKGLIERDVKIFDAYENDQLSKKIKHSEINETNMFLNFNYTPTVDNYINSMWNNSFLNHYGESKQIQIHGRLNEEDNPINFGFGDEMDNHYKLIEEKNDNEYLKNIKSFQYLQNSNYKDLLDFIDSEKFQVYIMGHSCGLSDRILLNTIFEHEHCRSIKVFYHEKDGKDNYTDIVQNISRHFNKKKMMRDKLVNKSLCQPLPQNIRFALKK